MYRFLLLILCVFADPVIAELNTRDVRWQTVELNHNKIGHRQIIRERQADQWLTTEKLVITLQQPGEDARSSESTLIYRETLKGKPLALEKTLVSNSANHHMRARVNGKVLQVSRQHGPQRETREFAIPENFLLREGVRRALSEMAGERRELHYHRFNFSAMRFERYQLIAERQEKGWLLERRQIEPIRSDGTQLIADQDFAILEERSVSSGEPLLLRTCSRECALKDFFPVTHVYRQLIRAPFRIPESALRGHIRYTLRGPFKLTPPQTAQQKVTRTEQGWQLDICGDCGTEPAPGALELQTYRQSGYWIGADHPEVRAVLPRVLKGEEGVTEVMPKLTRFVSLSMDDQPDYSGFATALEALRSQRGDCTEHALLLTALARAAGFPARVAIGIAYTNERFMGRNYVFVPHAWAQVWDGEQWRSYDSALGEFTAGYIALGLSASGELTDFTTVNEQLHQLELVKAVQVVQSEG